MKKLLSIVGLLAFISVSGFCSEGGDLGFFVEGEERSGTARHSWSRYGINDIQPTEYTEQRVGIIASKPLTSKLSLDASIGFVRVSDVHKETLDISNYENVSEGRFYKVVFWIHFD